MNRLKLSLLLILGVFVLLKKRQVTNRPPSHNVPSNDCEETANKLAETPVDQPIPPSSKAYEEKWSAEQRASLRTPLWPQRLLAATAIVTSVIGLCTLYILKNTLELNREQLQR